MKPANAKIRALFGKLQALAERGIDGEKAVALALGLGKQIRFSAPLEQITAELEAVATRYLAQD